MTTLNSEIQKLAASAIIELFVLDLTALGDSTYYFHAGTNGIMTNVVWQGQSYSAFPISATGFDFSTSGQVPRPKLAVSNVDGAITALVLTLSDLVGAKVTRKRTLAKFLDAVNFTGSVNPDADSNAHFPDEIYYIDRKATENRNVVEFELSAPYELSGIQLPRRQIVQGLCGWKYRGTECGYSASTYFKNDDTSTGSSTLDVCGKRLSSCKVRFGDTAELPFGGFPSADQG